MRSLPERGAPSHRQCPPICPPQALLQLVQEKPLWGEKRGDSAQKRGPYSLPFSGAGVGNGLSRRGGVSPSPIAPPSPTDTRGENSRHAGAEESRGRAREKAREFLSVPLASVRVQTKAGNALPCLLFPRMVGGETPPTVPRKGVPCRALRAIATQPPSLWGV